MGAKAPFKKNEAALALLECRLDTGRTHQIRVHAAHHGHPLVGDKTYATRPRKLANERLRTLCSAFPRQALHAVSLSFIHPKTGKTLTCEAEYPEDFATLLAALRATNP